MNSSCKLDYETAQKINNIGKRLSTAKNCLELLLYCVEAEIFSQSIVELYSFGTVLNEYFEKTKELYNNIEFELGTLQ